jgi:hypothetical protein
MHQLLKRNYDFFLVVIFCSNYCILYHWICQLGMFDMQFLLLVCKKNCSNIFNNYWMRLSVVSRIIKAGVVLSAGAAGWGTQVDNTNFWTYWYFLHFSCPKLFANHILLLLWTSPLLYISLSKQTTFADVTNTVCKFDVISTCRKLWSAGVTSWLHNIKNYL